MGEGKVIVVNGLPASGKTTAIRHFSAMGMATVLHDPKGWGKTPFPTHIKPRDQSEKRQKQEILLTIDQERAEEVYQLAAQGEDVICDSDFLTTLAYNYAERDLSPHLNVFDWLVASYCSLLHLGKIRVAQAYIFLDVPLETRRLRHRSDSTRQRNTIFFDPQFAESMRYYYLASLQALQSHGLSEVHVVPYCEELEPALENLSRLVARIARGRANHRPGQVAEILQKIK